MLNLYICQICGEPHLAEEPPTDCQFCGAPKNYLKPANEFSAIWEAEITDDERKHVEETLALEVNATAYYLDVSKAHGKYSKWNRLYKGLARVEKEHAEIAAKVMGVPLPEFTGEKSRGDIAADLERTRELEAHAAELYRKFMKQAATQKMQWLFHALAHAEEGHGEHAAAELGKL